MDNNMIKKLSIESDSYNLNESDRIKEVNKMYLEKMGTNHSIDFEKVKTLDDVKEILKAMNLKVNDKTDAYEKLKKYL